MNKDNIKDEMVIGALGIALLMTFFFGTEQLAMSIASGLIGYLGGSKLNKNEKVGNEK